MLLFSKWRNEYNDLHPDDKEKCIEEFKKRNDEISKNKCKIYPGEDTTEMLETVDMDIQRPAHVFDILDSQMQQNEEDDLETGAVDDPDYESFSYTGNLGKENTSQFESCKYRKIILPNEDEIKFLTRRMVPEQLNVLRKVIEYCKDVRKSEKNISHVVKPLRIIVHGGQGKKSKLFYF